MIYLDASCLVDLVRTEETCEAVARTIAKENYVVVSSLAHLETLIELKAGYMGGKYPLSKWRKSEAQLEVFRNQQPFYFRPVPAGIWEIALRQHRNSTETHCRALDRLHLATAERMSIRRLMTNDKAQAKAAEELGFEVVRPTL